MSGRRSRATGTGRPLHDGGYSARLLLKQRSQRFSARSVVCDREDPPMTKKLSAYLSVGAILTVAAVALGSGPALPTGTHTFGTVTTSSTTPASSFAYYPAAPSLTAMTILWTARDSTFSTYSAGEYECVFSTSSGGTIAFNGGTGNAAVWSSSSGDTVQCVVSGSSVLFEVTEGSGHSTNTVSWAYEVSLISN